MNQRLVFNDDGTFRIFQFTDLHFQNGGPEDQRTLRLMRTALAEPLAPNLIVFTGDVIAGGDCDDPVRSLEMAIQPAIEAGVPWAAVFGNHDDEGSADRSQLMEAQRKLPGCRSEPGPPHLPGIGNYTLDVERLVDSGRNWKLVFLDSLSYAPPDIGGYAWVEPAQIEWFASVAGGADRVVLFLHLPLPEYEDVWKLTPCQGHRHEDVCAPKVNSGLFAAARNLGNVTSVFCGHDHVNDYNGELDGIRLCYGRASGYNTYGRDGFRRGWRTIMLDSVSGGISTWVDEHGE